MISKELLSEVLNRKAINCYDNTEYVRKIVSCADVNSSIGFNVVTSYNYLNNSPKQVAVLDDFIRVRPIK